MFLCPMQNKNKSLAFWYRGCSFHVQKSMQCFGGKSELKWDYREALHDLSADQNLYIFLTTLLALAFS